MYGNERVVNIDRMPLHRGNLNGNEMGTGQVVELMIHLALVALFIWAVIMVVRFTVKYLNARAVVETATAEDIAKRRFASGEITKEEFEQLKKDLK